MGTQPFVSLDCSQSVIFLWDHKYRSLSSMGRILVSWWCDPHAINPTASTLVHFVLSPEGPRWWPVKLNDRHPQSHGIMRTMNSQEPMIRLVACFLHEIPMALHQEPITRAFISHTNPILCLWGKLCLYLSIFRHCRALRFVRAYTICYTVQYNKTQYTMQYAFLEI